MMSAPIAMVYMQTDIPAGETLDHYRKRVRTSAPRPNLRRRVRHILRMHVHA